jgi:hypothetical protein
MQTRQLTFPGSVNDRPIRVSLSHAGFGNLNVVIPFPFKRTRKLNHRGIVVEARPDGAILLHSINDKCHAAIEHEGRN